MTNPNTPNKLQHRADPISATDNAERLRKIRAATERSTHHPDDSRVDYEDPAFRAIAPQGWSRHHG